MRSCRWSLILLVITLSAFAGCSTSPRTPASPQKARHWQPAHVATQTGQLPNLCRDLYFVDSRRGLVCSMGFKPNPGGLLKTADGGATWTEQSGITGERLSVAPDGTIWLTALSLTPGKPGSQIARSVDGGATWKFSTLPKVQLTGLAAVSRTEAWGIQVLADNYQLASLTPTLWHTTDGGATWQQMPHPYIKRTDIRFVGIHFFDRNHGWVACFDSASPATQPTALPLALNIMRTTDAGKSWQVVQTISLTADTILDGPAAPFHFTSATDGWFAPGDNHLLHTTDGGQNWQVLTLTLKGVKPADLQLHDCAFPTPQLGWAVGKRLIHPRTTSHAPVFVPYQAVALTTTDGSKTWQQQETGAEGIDNCDLLRLYFTDPQHGWLIGQGGEDHPGRPMKFSSFVLKYVP